MGGFVAPGFEGVGDAFEQAQTADVGGAQLCIYRRGEMVVDLWTGRDVAADRPYLADTPTVLMSCSKAVVALCVHRLAEQGVLDIEAPIARYWPPFAAGGKIGLTLAHVLSHSAGLAAFAPDAGVDVEAMKDFGRCADALAEQTPLWPPGSAYAYHAITYGYLIGEVVRRVTGRSLGAYLAEEIAEPLNLDLWIGLPDAQQARVARHFRPNPPGGEAGWKALFAAGGMDVDSEIIRAFVQMFVVTDQLINGMNTAPWRAAEIPAGNGIGTARSLAKLYAASIGEVDGFRVISQATLARAIAPRTDGLFGPPPFPQTRGRSAQRFGLGFELPRDTMPMLGPRSFGHPGAGGRLGYADADFGVAAAFACNNMLWDGITPDPRWAWNKALRAAVGAGP